MRVVRRVHLGCEVRVERAAGDGATVTATLTRRDDRQLDLACGDEAYAAPRRTCRFDASRT